MVLLVNRNGSRVVKKDERYEKKYIFVESVHALGYGGYDNVQLPEEKYREWRWN